MNLEKQFYTLNNTKSLYRILVPTVRNDGRPFNLRYHRVWDAKVREITGGLTIMPVAKGQWVNGNDLFVERMIPVELMATEKQMIEIVAITLAYYEQLAVMWYRISDDVNITYRSVE
jgi:hypothetical protein